MDDDISLTLSFKNSILALSGEHQSLSIYHAFTDRPKTSLEKSFMLFFAVLLNAFSGILAGMYDLAATNGWLVIFPLLNIINGIALIFMFRMGILSEADISDRHASRSQFLLTAAVVFILFAACHYIFSLIWMQTLSICVAYATNLGRSVPLLILGESPKSYSLTRGGNPIMPRCLIVFFSQGGTTNRVAESIARGLRAGNHDVDLHNLKDGPAPDPGKYDVLGLGTPAYYFRLPFIVSDYLDSLPDLSGKPVFTFVMYGVDCGDAGNAVRRALERKNGKETGYARYHGADYFLGYLKHGYLFSPNYPKPDDIAQAELFGRDISACLGGRAYVKPEYDSPPAMIYRLERFLTNRLFVRQMYSRLLTVNRKKCSACGLCMKLCPTRNISEDSNGYPVWGRNCILCFSCEMKCPKDAIGSPVTWFMFWPFMVYNTRHAARDPAIEHVRVAHAHGRTSTIR